MNPSRFGNLQGNLERKVQLEFSKGKAQTSVSQCDMCMQHCDISDVNMGEGGAPPRRLNQKTTQHVEVSARVPLHEAPSVDRPVGTASWVFSQPSKKSRFQSIEVTKPRSIRVESRVTRPGVTRAAALRAWRRAARRQREDRKSSDLRCRSRS